MISLTESCLFLINCCLRAQDNRHPLLILCLAPCAQRFLQILRIFWWEWFMWVSLCNFILRNIIQKLFHNGWTSVNFHFWEQLRLYDAFETCFFKIGNRFFLKFSFPLFKHWICFLGSIVLLFQQSTTAHLKKYLKFEKLWMLFQRTLYEWILQEITK